MPKVKAVGLQRRTIGLMNDFFNDIDMLNDNNLSNYQMNLPIRVKKFFDDMNQLGEQEFAEFLKKHQFENRDHALQQKYKDTFNCLVALIVNEYDESDLLRYFLPKKYSIEAKPTLESNAWRVVHWAQLLGYWVRKLFNTQRFEMVNAETDNESLGSAIKAIKQDLSESNYFDLLKNDTFKGNLETVVGKFVENRNKANVEHAENDTSSNGDVPPPLADSDESFREGGFKFGSSTSTSEQATKSVLPPPPPPPAPNSSTLKPVSSASPGPSSSSVKTTKSPVDNDRNTLLDAIRKGIKLKPAGERAAVEPKGPLKTKVNINKDSLTDILKEALQNIRISVNGSVGEDGVEAREDISTNGGGWDTDDCVDSVPRKEAIYFVELDDKSQLEAMMRILEENIPQDFEFTVENPDCLLLVKGVEFALARINSGANSISRNVFFSLNTDSKSTQLENGEKKENESWFYKIFGR